MLSEGQIAGTRIDAWWTHRRRHQTQTSKVQVPTGRRRQVPSQRPPGLQHGGWHHVSSVFLYHVWKFNPYKFRLWNPLSPHGCWLDSELSSDLPSEIHLFVVSHIYIYSYIYSYIYICKWTPISCCSNPTFWSPKNSLLPPWPHWPFHCPAQRQSCGRRVGSPAEATRPHHSSRDIGQKRAKKNVQALDPKLEGSEVLRKCEEAMNHWQKM